MPAPPPYIAVVGPGDGATDDAIDDALVVGRAIAARGWILLCGGRDAGVMAAAARGARAGGGLAIGILPGTTRDDASPDLTIALPTGLGEARNAVLVTAADAVIACGMNPGTASEVALALRAGKPTVLVGPSPETSRFFETIAHDGSLYVAGDAESAITWVSELIPLLTSGAP